MPTVGSANTQPARITPREVGLWVAFIALNTATQLAFKRASGTLDSVEMGAQFVEMAVGQSAVWVAIAGYVAVFLVWIRILQASPLSRAFLMSALVYIPVTLGAWAIFGEAVGAVRIAGIVLIVLGVALLGVEGRAAGGQGQERG